MPPPVLWWIKKDFRLADNPALMAALASGETVLPVFVFEPALLEAEETSAFHVAAWCEALGDLRQRLNAHCGDLLALHMGAIEALDRLHEATGFTEMHSHEEIGTSVTYGRDRAVAAWCADRGVAWH
ncbi:MAG: deoxyribodipyrimidine photo-lyase, partial [Bacteroidota bacterium]